MGPCARDDMGKSAPRAAPGGSPSLYLRPVVANRCSVDHWWSTRSERLATAVTQTEQKSNRELLRG